MTESTPDRQPSETTNRLLFAGLLGLSVSSIVELTSLDNVSYFSAIALYSFAVAIPLLSASLIAELTRPLRSGRHPNWIRTACAWLGVIATVFAVANCFLHMGVWIGVVFVVVGAVSMLAVRKM